MLGTLRFVLAGSDVVTNSTRDRPGENRIMR